MELKDFVKRTILDILEGVKEAQDENTTGARINFPWYQVDKKETWTEVAFLVCFGWSSSLSLWRGL